MTSALLLSAVLAAPAAAHTVTARFITPQGAYSKTVVAAEGAQVNDAAPAAAEPSGAVPLLR